MSFIPVLQYGVGAGVMGFIGWLLSGVLEDLVAVGVHETGTVFDFLFYLWTAMFILYLVFGGWWMIRMYNENQYRSGGFV